MAGDRPRELLVDFARAFHFGTPLAYFAGRTDGSLAAELVSAFDFLEGRKHGEIRVRIVPGPGSALVQATLRDQPFLLDSVREALRAAGIQIRRILHPLLRTERGDEGRLLAVRPRTDQGSMESFLHFETEVIADPAAAAKVEMEIRESLREAALAAGDFPQMKAALETAARELLAERPKDPALLAELSEAAEFLRWLLRGNFVFLGYRAYEIQERGGERFVAVAPRSGLGILRDPSASSFFQPVPLSSLGEGVRSRILRKVFPIISRTGREARVHRRARMDSVEIQRLSSAGDVAGEHRFLGFFTAQALNHQASEMPVLRRKLQRILRRAQVLEGSHDHKQIVTIFDGLPKMELFTAEEAEIGRAIQTIMEMQTEEGVRISFRRDDLGLGVSVLVILPRDRFNADVRLRLQEALSRRFGAQPTDYRLALSEEHFARLHFYFPCPPEAAFPSAEALELDARAAVRTWEDELRDELAARLGPDRGNELANRLAGSLPAGYRSLFRPAEAVEDVSIVDDLAARDGVRLRLEDRQAPGGEPATLLRLYRSGTKFYLSDIMPVLTNLGLRVIDEQTFAIEAPGARPVHLHAIGIQDAEAPAGGPAPVARERWPALSEAVLALIDGRSENDGLGALVLRGLSIRQAELLRTYIHYFRQLRVPHTGSSMIAALLAHPEVACGLVERFEEKFRPAPGGEKEIAAAPSGSRAALLSLLERVEDLNRDRILRGLLDLVEATVRTNYFQKGGTLPRIAIKIRSDRIAAMPRPVPLYEIFVHNAEMEGIHLRSGKLARGGIRWSDRRDDYRTEVLGLLRTQSVKNAVIVPVGSKGGFVLKRAADPREGLPAQVARQYRTLISGMLDLTDNLVEGKVVHPADTAVWDGPDPYLVVAADKGTATFSDLANSIAREYGFWLGDAFASGGSCGYDHKKLGITARGAWECSRHLLRELGIDPEGELTVAGIGDMSGDVFGNGLLLSRRFKLLAAFDHSHVFLDPLPDPEVSYLERERLFGLPRSSWADYDPSKISKGGGVFRRDAKKVSLSAEAKALLGVPKDELTGEELVREVLKLPVDLLWSGGIGTYVKASSETHADAGDSRNDPVRIDAADLRARVVAEGGNLGFTQAARIEYAFRGGRISTDFIDNSAGVDLSDHEVNIKIALAGAIRAGRLGEAERDRLLESMTDEVCGLVLRNNREHAQVLSLEERLSREDLGDYWLLARGLAEAGLLEARFERFPDAAEMRRREERRRGLARPELAVLLAFSKIEISRALRETDLVETPGFESYLSGYFPGEISSRCGDLLRGHPLAREIAASALTNEIAARGGISFAARLRSASGASIEDAVRAYRAADILLGVSGTIPPVQDLLIASRQALERIAGWLLRSWPRGADGRPAAAGEVAGELRPCFERLSAWLGVDAAEDIAAKARKIEDLGRLPPAVDAARRAGADPLQAAKVCRALRALLRLDDVERAAGQLPALESDDRAAGRGVLAQAESLLADLAAQVLEAPWGREADPERAAEELLASRGPALVAYRRSLPETGRPFGLGSLLLLAERLRALAAG